MDAKIGSTRARMIEAAYALFLQHGYNGTGVNQILARSGLSKGAFYHHFKNKDEIYAEIIDGFFLTPLQSAAFTDMADLPLRDMRSFLTNYYAGLPENVAQSSGIDMARYYALFFEAISRLPGFREKVQAHYRQTLETFSNKTYQEREVFPKVAKAHARNVVAALEGRTMIDAILNANDNGEVKAS